MTAWLALALLAVVVIVVVNLVARRTGLPAAVLLVVAGVAYAWLPGPNVQLQPKVVLDVVIPPLLYAAAINSSAIALRRNVRTLVSLSFTLVLVTAVATGFAVTAAVPAVPVAAAVALGAAVAPTDPVAALAIGRRAGLPPRLITIVEGEGLLNDATALTLLEVAIAAQTGHGFSALSGAGQFLLALGGGTVAGLLVAVVCAAVRRRVNDPLADNVVSLGTPFAAFLLAELVHGSGVLGVVVAGLWFAHRGPTVQTGPSRLQSTAVWSLVEYVLEGLVFLLIGQQLPDLLTGLRDYAPSEVLAAVGVTVGTVVLIRPLWLAVSERLPARLHTRLGQHDPTQPHQHLDRRDIVALSWAGTRGVITLAAAFSLPFTADGRAFPARDLLLFCAYVVVFVTLVGQGLTFGFVLRRLRYRSTASAEALLRNEARVAAVRAALARLDALTEQERLPLSLTQPLREAAESRLDRYASRVERLSALEGEELPPDDAYFTAVRIRRELIAAERDELLQWRDTGRMSDATLRALQRELDHEEGLLPL